jgi:hypothetical protein
MNQHVNNAISILWMIEVRMVLNTSRTSYSYWNIKGKSWRASPTRVS